MNHRKSLDRRIFRMYNEDHHLCNSIRTNDEIIIPLDCRDFVGEIDDFDAVVMMMRKHNALMNRMNASSEMYLTYEEVESALIRADPANERIILRITPKDIIATV